jgi:hypothetical protein
MDRVAASAIQGGARSAVARRSEQPMSIGPSATEIAREHGNLKGYSI